MVAEEQVNVSEGAAGMQAEGPCTPKETSREQRQADTTQPASRVAGVTKREEEGQAIDAPRVSDDPHRRERGAKTVAQLLRNLIIKIAIIALAVWATLAFVLCVTVQYGNDMHPAFRDGDLVVALRLQRPYINAAVVYEHNGKRRVGRVIALGGNEVDVTPVGELRVNGVSPAEEVFYPTYAAEGADVTYPYEVPEGCAFVLNDFRSDTNDSRSFGAVSIEDIDGPIIFAMRIRGF